MMLTEHEVELEKVHVGRFVAIEDHVAQIRRVLIARVECRSLESLKVIKGFLISEIKDKGLDNKE